MVQHNFFSIIFITFAVVSSVKSVWHWPNWSLLPPPPSVAPAAWPTARLPPDLTTDLVAVVPLNAPLKKILSMNPNAKRRIDKEHEDTAELLPQGTEEPTENVKKAKDSNADEEDGPSWRAGGNEGEVHFLNEFIQSCSL